MTATGRGRLICFWIATAIIVLETGVGSEWDLARNAFVRGIMEQVGYPAYVLTIMGVWKTLAVFALLAPRMARLKEWAYAGVFFVYSGAAVSHLAVGEGSKAVGPFVFALLALVSYMLRPASRRDFAPLPTAGWFGGETRRRKIWFWIVTILSILPFGTGGIGDILRPAPLVAGMVHLGYPVYFCLLLGVWKVLGAIAVAVPGLPRLKEWAYAGAIFDLTGAACSHIAVGDPVIRVVMPLILGAIVMLSWALRPMGRREIIG